MEIYIFIILSISPRVIGVCYFPLEYQGIFSTQAGVSGEKSHKYLQITILPDAIPVWGVCHEMNGPLVILRDSTGGEECFRCFHVTLQSPNVFQIFTEGIDKCYIKSKSAKTSCPTTAEIKNKIAREIMLYKSRSFTPEGFIDRYLCPFSGKFHFTYDINDGAENELECPDSKSLISNCPLSSQLQLSFRQCKFENTNMTLRCLGDWKGIDGNRYFALWDTRVTSDDQPQYRCAMYHVDSNTGRIFIAFSIDATCTNRLHSPWDGYETMVLTPFKRPSPPAPVHTYNCIFPQWANGIWKDVEINGRNLVWKDKKGDKIYESLCLTRNNPNQERFVLYSLNQCGDEKFTCIWIKKRDRDVMEFKMASVQYNYFSNSQICSDDVFIGQIWNTQGRILDSDRKNCLVIGEYTGVLPDNPSLCAKLATDCRNPSMKYFTVYSCENSSQIFEIFEDRSKRNIYSRERVRRLRESKHIVAENPNMRRQSHFLIDSSYHQTERSSFKDWPRPLRRHSSVRYQGSDPFYVFPVQSLEATTTSHPYLHDKPFYYYVDQFGNEIEDMNNPSIVSDRYYRCLGQWKENGIMYTYTYRSDVHVYECFAGVIVSPNEAFIIEAGDNCQRGLQPLVKGMKLIKKSSCDDYTTNSPTKSSKVASTLNGTERPAFPAWWPSTTRKPWFKKSTTTTKPKNLWNDQQPKSSSKATKMFWNSFVLCFVFSLSLILR